LTRLSVCFASACALAALSMPVFQAAAQQNVPAAPAKESSATVPSGPAPIAAPVFPKPNPANFTASSPTKEAIDAFLHASWGYDENRIWQVQAILKTSVEGVSKILILVGDKSGKQKLMMAQFFSLPDGKHIFVGNDIISFGEKPYADARAELQKRADGPYRGSASKDLEIVEFADYECPHCKEAQANMDKLAVDFPKARIVFQTYPLESIHAQSERAAAYGLCVNKQGGSNAFFTFSAAVFDGQAGLATADGATMALNSAVTKIGLDPVKIAACAATPATTAAVNASIKLAKDMDINQTPMLVVNGRQFPANISYDVIKKIVVYQAKLDGVAE
jgi:protein-disulfide isomerase